MNFVHGTKVAFEEHKTRRTLEGVVVKCQDGQVCIATADGKVHSRVVSRVIPQKSPIPMSLHPEPTLVPTKSDIQTRFKCMRDAVVMVAKGYTVSTIVSGPGGLGKTHTVTEVLKEIGLRKDVDYQVVKGYTSARGLYESLYYNNGKLTVLDDCDNALNDRISKSLLKGALDSYSTREISWVVKSAPTPSTIPLRFEFTGRIIFLTNKLVRELDEPLLTRSLVIDLQMTRAEILQRMEQILPMVTDFDMNDKVRALNFIRELAPRIRNLSLRSLVMVLRMMNSDNNNWQKLATESLTI